MARKVVIIGGVAGGASAAVRARRLDEQADIVLLEKGGYISFANCGLPYYIGDTIKRRKDLLVQTPKAMKARFNIDVRVENEAVKIDPAAKTVKVQNHATGETYQEPYDKLIIATGSVPVIPPIPGADEDNIFTIWSIPDTDKIKEYVTAKALKRAVVVGGGFVGMEMVENLHAIGLEVSVVEMLDQVMNTVDFDMAQYVHRELRASGVALYLEEKVVAFRREGDETLVELGSGKQLPVDLVIMAAGIKPSSALAADAGLTLGPRGHIVTNEYLQTSNPDIYAVGDVIEVEDFMTKGRTAVPLAGPANKQGRIAADNVCGIPSKYHGTQGTSVAKVFDKTIASTGLTEKALIRAGKKPYEDFLALHGHPFNHATYYPGGEQIHIKLLFSPGDGKILGAQAVGGSGTDKRIDVIATCIRYGGVVSDLTGLELAYAPPYNTAKDPVNLLGYMAENVLTKRVDTIQWNEVPHLDPEKYQLLDVRTEKEHAEGTIPGSIQIGVDELRDNLDKIDRNKTAVVYCRVGLRSYIAARILSQNCIPVKSLSGGWLTWEAATFDPVK